MAIITTLVRTIVSLVVLIITTIVTLAVAMFFKTTETVQEKAPDWQARVEHFANQAASKVQQLDQNTRAKLHIVVDQEEEVA